MKLTANTKEGMMLKIQRLRFDLDDFLRLHKEHGVKPNRKGLVCKSCRMELEC